MEVDYFIGGGAGPACMKDLVVKSQAADIIDLIFTVHKAPQRRPQAMSQQESKGCGALNI